jgi:hypothetical protein
MRSAFKRGGARRAAHDVFLGKLQLRSVLDGHNPLAIGNEIAQAVEQRRFAAARAAGNQDVAASDHRRLEEFCDCCR